MNARRTVEFALELAGRGLSATEIADSLGVPRRTVSDWIGGAIPRQGREGACPKCHAVHDFAVLGSDYVHLLGLYLGDGCLSRQARDVYKLRVFLDVRYPSIIAGAQQSIGAVAARSANTLTRDGTCTEVYACWRAWPCLFPQHAPGKKHERPIVLAGWQTGLVERWPTELLRGLVESDGCRFENTGRNGWRAPRYAFKNHSADIHGIFRIACQLVGVRWTAAGADTTYVSRQADVAVLDEFIGPKR